MAPSTSLVALFAASLLAGAQNALAGGGSFVTFPALLLAGLDPRAANVTSTVASFPGQALAGWAGRSFARGAPSLSFRALCAIGLLGGALGAVFRACGCCGACRNRCCAAAWWPSAPR